MTDCLINAVLSGGHFTVASTYLHTPPCLHLISYRWHLFLGFYYSSSEHRRFAFGGFGKSSRHEQQKQSKAGGGNNNDDDVTLEGKTQEKKEVVSVEQYKEEEEKRHIFSYNNDSQVARSGCCLPIFQASAAAKADLVALGLFTHDDKIKVRTMCI